MDMNKMKSKWRKVYNINALSTGEKINLYDIMHNGILRDRYIGRILIETQSGDREI
jgi:hypothetical protein